MLHTAHVHTHTQTMGHIGKFHPFFFFCAFAAAAVFFYSFFFYFVDCDNQVDGRLRRMTCIEWAIRMLDRRERMAIYGGEGEQ